jgi:hypothetical protein
MFITAIKGNIKSKFKNKKREFDEKLTPRASESDAFNPEILQQAKI